MRRTEQMTPRPASPAVGVPAKPQLSVEEWEAKAPLSENVTRSVNALKRACEQRPLPLKFATEDPPESSSGPSTSRGPSRPDTPVSAGGGIPPNPLHPLHPIIPISTPQQFYDWFSGVERTISHSQEAQFRNYLGMVEDHLARCDAVSDRIVEVQEQVEGMLKEWRNVEDGAESLQAACERLLEERDRLIEVTDAIAIRMEYYQELEHAMRMLNHPGDSLVLQTEFLLMVERVDVCIEYFQNHRHFAEADVYLLRFQQCMTRAMTLIKIYFVSTLKALAADIQRQFTEKDLSETASLHLLYSKFNSIAPQTAPLLAELERRATEHPDELSSLLTECHTTYFTARKALVVGRLAEEIRILNPGTNDLVELTRSGCSYLKQLCTDEFELYRRFFDSGEDKLYRYLENLCDYLYDDLRPRILHEPQLSVLGQVCTVLQALMVLDVPSTSSPSDPDEDDVLSLHQQQPRTAMLPTHPSTTLTSRLISLVGAEPTDIRDTKPLRRLHTAQLLEMILQDAQTRLFFKAQAVVQSEIRYYSPKGEDLKYPDKLIAGKQAPTRLAPSIDENDDDDPLKTISSRSSRETWYPTLDKLLWILALLRDFVKPAIFIDMAQEAISYTRQSLITASELLRPALAKSLRSNADADVHARLFLVRHLLVLKEIANVLSVESEEKESKPVGMKPLETIPTATDTLSYIMRGTTSMLGGLTTTLGMGAQTVENMGTVKVAIDQDLKRVCEELIQACTDAATTPIRASSSNPTPQSPSAETIDAFKKALTGTLSTWIVQLRLYLENSNTVAILVAPMQSGVLSVYEEWIGSISDKAGPADVLSVQDVQGLLEAAVKV